MKSTEKLITPESNYYLYTPSLLAREHLLYPTIVGNFRYEPGYHIHRNHFDSFLIMLIEEGTCHIIEQGRKWTAPKGSLVFLDCYAEHEYGSDSWWKTLWLHFDGSVARSFYEKIFQNHGTVIFPKNYQYLYYELDSIYKDFYRGNPVNEARYSVHIYSILSELLLNQNNASYTNASGIKHAISYINENFASPVSLNELAEIASLSVYYFSRLFKAETGMSPHQYLIETRISSAKYFLVNSSLSIKEIAFQTGFADESSFCACFKKREKVTPLYYRSHSPGQQS